MVKSVLKEIIILMLLFLAILVVLGILLYDYFPMTKTLPTQVAYTTPEDVKEELAEMTVDKETIVMTYSVDSSDLRNYQISSDYTSGKANPFSTYVEEAPTENPDGNSGSTNNGSSSGSSSSGGSYFDDEGTK